MVYSNVELPRKIRETLCVNALLNIHYYHVLNIMHILGHAYLAQFNVLKRQYSSIIFISFIKKTHFACVYFVYSFIVVVIYAENFLLF